MASVDGKRSSDKPTDTLRKFRCDPCAFSGLVKEASTYCKQCQEYMCITCASVHSGLQLTRSHTTVSGSDLAFTGQSVAASRSTRPVSTRQSLAASRSTRLESTGQSVAVSRSTRPESTRQSVAASRSTRLESTGQSVAASRSTRIESTGQSVAASRSTRLQSTGQSVEASRSTSPVSTRQSLAASRSTRLELTGQSVAVSRSTRPESTRQSVAASRSTRLESTGQSVAASRSTRLESTGQSVAASRSTRLESTGQSVAASRSTRLESTRHKVAASRSTRPESTGQSVAASRSTHPQSTRQSVAASRSTRPESTGPSRVDRPVATSSSDCPESVRKSWLDMEVVSSTVIHNPSTDVTGSAVMPDGRLILADCGGTCNQIILLDQNFTVQSTLPLPSEPWDVAVYGDNAAVVTMPDLHQIQYIHVDTTLRAGHTIQTELQCWGVAVHGDQIYMYVGVEGGRYGVHVMDIRGNLTRRIVPDVQCTGCVPIWPTYIAVGAGGTVYMSDFVSGYIACFTSAGDAVYEVKHEGMSDPHGMLVDNDDNLLVCGYASNTVHVLGMDGAHHRVILSSADGVVYPRSVSYRRSDQTLIVTMWNTPSCRAYKMN